MARTLAPARAPRDPALKLLKADHDEVKVLFDEYDDTDEPEERQVVADRLRGLLTVHAAIEAEIFYPALREALDDEDRHLLLEAETEHAVARELIAKLAAATDTERAAALVRVLGEYVRHHADEEEDEIFPRARDAALDQAALAVALAARKQALMAELGIGDDESESDEDEDEDDDDEWSDEDEDEDEADDADDADDADEDDEDDDEDDPDDDADLDEDDDADAVPDEDERPATRPGRTRR